MLYGAVRFVCRSEIGSERAIDVDECKMVQERWYNGSSNGQCGIVE